MRAARAACENLCKRNTGCAKNESCQYYEKKLVGTTTYDPATDRWTSTQTSSGECHCTGDLKIDCDTSIEQTVVNFGANHDTVVADAQNYARTLAAGACISKNCAATKKCQYKEKTPSGKTEPDAKWGWKSTQTSEGKCECS